MNTLEEVIEATGITFGDIEIAVNLNKFRRAEPTEKFWELWKAQKEKMREIVSVYKNGTFFVYDWNFEKASKEEYEEFLQQIKTKKENKEKKESFFKQIQDLFLSQAEQDLRSPEYENLFRQVNKTKNLEELVPIMEKYLPDVQKWIEYMTE